MANHSDESAESVRKDQVAGRLLTTRLARKRKYLDKELEAPNRNWRPAQHERFGTVVEQIEKRFDFVFKRSKDGTPYPFHPSTMPEDWSYWTAWSLFSHRIWRMWTLCNRRPHFNLPPTMGTHSSFIQKNTRPSTMPKPSISSVSIRRQTQRPKSGWTCL